MSDDAREVLPAAYDGLTAGLPPSSGTTIRHNPRLECPVDDTHVIDTSTTKHYCRACGVWWWNR